MGPYRTGKSFLLDRLIPHDEGVFPFKVSFPSDRILRIVSVLQKEDRLSRRSKSDHTLLLFTFTGRKHSAARDGGGVNGARSTVCHWLEGIVVAPMKGGSVVARKPYGGSAFPRTTIWI